MQAGKNAVATAKESVANINASAKAGLEKTQATLDGKVYIYIYVCFFIMENMKAHDTAQKEMATRKKEERITQIELEEKQARACNAATKEMGNAGTGHPTGTHPISALPGHGGGQPVVGSHPIGTDTGNFTGYPTGNHPISALPGHGSGQHVVWSQPEGTDTGNGTDHPTGNHPISALPGHGSGQHVVGSQPEGTDTGHPTGNHPISALPGQAGHGTCTGTGTNGTYSTTGATGHPTGTHPTSALPGHGTGQPAVQVTEGVVGSQPIASYTAATGRTAAHDPRVEGNAPGYRKERCP
ncbi:hypothetical protein FH972_020171 [Carpinus fangiana]|uniref:18 kDa seed maturation protein n=1 Tax=Carpinus fangiana TaxID=176857 RepID=A0A5N6RSW3_9ROSI|nr:hypothetical protein FH972_020171 [Carpinus fangiana]